MSPESGPSSGAHRPALARRRRPDAVPPGHRRLPPRHGRGVRRRDGDLRAALRASRRCCPSSSRRTTSPRRETTLTLSLTTAALGRGAARRRAGLGGGRPHPADPPRHAGPPRSWRVGCALAPTWEALLVLRMLAGRDPGRAAGRRDGLPPRGAAPLGPRSGLRSLHRRHRPGRHGRPGGHGPGGRRRGLALGHGGRRARRTRVRSASWRGCCPPSRHFVRRPADLRSVLDGARAAVRDRTLVALYVLGACGIGAMVAVFNALGFRLSSAALRALGSARSAWSSSSTPWARSARRRPAGSPTASAVAPPSPSAARSRWWGSG